jgi:hypothetical protein
MIGSPRDWLFGSRHLWNGERSLAQRTSPIGRSETFALTLSNMSLVEPKRVGHCKRSREAE